MVTLMVSESDYFPQSFTAAVHEENIKKFKMRNLWAWKSTSREVALESRVSAPLKSLYFMVARWRSLEIADCTRLSIPPEDANIAISSAADSPWSSAEHYRWQSTPHKLCDTQRDTQSTPHKRWKWNLNARVHWPNTCSPSKMSDDL